MGAVAKASSSRETVPRAIATGIRMQETMIKTAQTFSHDHLPRNFIGSVKVPFISPERIANPIPEISTELVATSLLRDCRWIARQNDGTAAWAS